MKTNSQLVISGAAENLIRLVDEQTQREMFLNDIDITLPKLIKAFPNTFTIGDAAIGMQGQGPLTLGEPAFLNLIFASRDIKNIDAVFCRSTMLGMPPYISNSAENFDTKNIEVVGNDLDALRYPIKRSAPDETPHPDIKLIEGKACPACFSAMFKLTSRLIGLRGEQINLVIGPVLAEEMLKGKERIVVFGDCAINKIKEGREYDIKPMAQISENVDEIEQLVLFKKLLTTKGETTVTPIDKVKSKMKKLLSKIVK